VSESGAWVTVRVLPGQHREEVATALFEAGAQGLQELGDALVTHAPDQTEADALVCAALAVGPEVYAETAPLDPVDWAERWKDSIGSHRLGRLTVAPPWLAGELDPRTTIVIEPQMAFGTGEHATTRGVIRLLQAVVREGDRVADLGAGSAVLAIAAAKLGATHVAAIEIDRDAIGNAEANVQRNGVADRVTVVEGDASVLLPLVAPVRVVTANIISSVLIELLPAIGAALAPRGRAILSGMLASERAGMIAAFGADGWAVDAEDEEDGWWSATILIGH
jgi:ribosomal protein L11 methyltransferase